MSCGGCGHRSNDVCTWIVSRRASRPVNAEDSPPARDRGEGRHHAIDDDDTLVRVAGPNVHTFGCGDALASLTA